MQGKDITIIGAGPSGLIAAETLARAGASVTIYERKSSPARKFLLAGRGGLNITHSEDQNLFKTRYGNAQNFLSSMLDDFTPSDMRDWCHGLGEETFIGSSGRVFPKSFKASPLLRAWLRRLEDLGVRIEYNMSWIGWDESGSLLFQNKARGHETVTPSAVLLALGGASWPNLGSDGGWINILRQKNIDVAPMKPANCGFYCTWSDFFKTQFAGKPLKSIAITHKGKTVKGEAMIDSRGIEGGIIYALSSLIRDDIEQNGTSTISIDLRPSLSLEDIQARFSSPRRKKTFSNYLRGVLSLSPIESAILYESERSLSSYDGLQMAQFIKNVPITLIGLFPIEKSISSAGGVRFEELTDELMLRKLPGTFCAGEMLDWEAPTGGYLLQGCFASGACAARGIMNYLGK